MKKDVFLYKKLILVYNRTLKTVTDPELESLLEDAIRSCFQQIEYLEKMEVVHEC